VPAAEVHPALQKLAQEPKTPGHDPKVRRQQHVHASANGRSAHRRHGGHLHLAKPVEGVVDLAHALVGVERLRVLAGRLQRGSAVRTTSADLRPDVDLVDYPIASRTSARCAPPLPPVERVRRVEVVPVPEQVAN
jgi:hypothetical protein